MVTLLFIYLFTCPFAQATDGDEPNTPNSELVFTIEPGPYSENFTIDPNTGVLTNKGPLDREDINPALNGKTELSVKISDKGEPPLSTTVQVFINVQVSYRGVKRAPNAKSC